MGFFGVKGRFISLYMECLAGETRTRRGVILAYVLIFTSHLQAISRFTASRAAIILVQGIAPEMRWLRI